MQNVDIFNGFKFLFVTMLQLQLFKNKNITNRIRELIVRVCFTAAQNEFELWSCWKKHMRSLNIS